MNFDDNHVFTVYTFIEEVGGDSFRGIAIHIPTDIRRAGLLLAKFLRMIKPMTTVTTKRAVVVIGEIIGYVGGFLRTEARVITSTDPSLGACLRPSFKASL